MLKAVLTKKNWNILLWFCDRLKSGLSFGVQLRTNELIRRDRRNILQSGTLSNSMVSSNSKHLRQRSTTHANVSCENCLSERKCEVFAPPGFSTCREGHYIKASYSIISLNF
jgi:hypothetical protein